MPYLLLLLLMLTSAGCYPVTRLQTPRTMPAGKVQLAAAVSGAHSQHAGLQAAPDVAFRMGLTDSTDVGVRVRPMAVEVGTKHQLLRDDVEISVAPAVLFAEARDNDWLTDESERVPAGASVKAFRGSVYIGSNADHAVSGWIAPTLDLGDRALGYSGSDHELLVVPGLLGGIAVAAANGSRFIMELGVLVPATGTSKIDRHIQTALGPGDIRVECSIGFSLGALSRPASRDPAAYPKRAAPVAD